VRAGLLVDHVVVALVITILLGEPKLNFSDNISDDEDGGVETGAVRRGG
jgi:hypothetical protein